MAAAVRNALVGAAALLAAAQGYTLAVAHRGASGYVGENTLTAFRLADSLGADAFELDVQMTLDRVPIVMHDETLDRTTNCTGRVNTVNYAGYVEYCIAGGVERVPTIRQLLDYAVTTDMQVYFDIKCPGACIEVLSEIVNTYPVDFSPRLTLGAWTQADLDVIAAEAPRFKRSFISSVLPRDPTNVDVTNFNLNFGAVRVDPTFVERAHANNQTIYVWTVNDEGDMAQALNLLVDGVVTDLPDVFIAVRDGKAAQH